MGEEVLKGNMKSLQTTDQESSLRDCVINAQHEQNILFVLDRRTVLPQELDVQISPHQPDQSILNLILF